MSMNIWKKISRPIILASQSPRRKEILSSMGLSFTVQPPVGVDEDSFFRSGDSLEIALKNVALAKAKVIAHFSSDSLVIGSDTVVVLDGIVMGKPLDYEDARTTLMALSGRKHKVCSSVAIVVESQKIELSAVATTEVQFRSFSLDEVEDYLSIAHYQDKAGSYGIQGEAMTFVDKIDGCYNNIVGLPVATTIALLQEYHTLKGDHYE